MIRRKRQEEEEEEKRQRADEGVGKRKGASKRIFFFVFSSFGRSRSFLRVVRRRLFEKRAILL